jgi:hypothetical protein
MDLTASEITKSCIKVLESRNCFAWRQVNTSVRGRKGVVTKGIPDVLFFNRSTGLFGAAEVKKSGDRLRSEQREFLFALHNAGGIALIATEKAGAAALIPFVDYIKD